MFETEPSGHKLSQEPLAFNLRGSSAECPAVMAKGLIPMIHVPNCQPPGPRLELCLRSGSGKKGVIVQSWIKVRTSLGPGARFRLGLKLGLSVHAGLPRWVLHLLYPSLYLGTSRLSCNDTEVQDSGLCSVLGKKL